MSGRHTICLLGLGEVGSTLAADLSASGAADLAAWDWQFPDPDSIPSQHAAGLPQLRQASSAEAAAQGCSIVISAVTAAQDLAAAESVLPGLEAGAWFLDLNSVSPATKQAVADAVGRAGGRYVEAAIMSPIAPQRIAAPILAGGPHAEAFAPIARQLGFAGLRFCDSRIGKAAATKMCRSIVIKGVEAVLTEALVSARHYGVEAEVIASLQNLLPHPDWEGQARYMISRALEHGTRRAEEMREAARTAAEAGLEPLMSEACARRQDWAPQFASALQRPGLQPMLEAILEQMDSGPSAAAQENGNP